MTAAHCQPGFLASLLVELGEYDISGPNEFMSTREQKVSSIVQSYSSPSPNPKTIPVPKRGIFTEFG